MKTTADDRERVVRSTYLQNFRYLTQLLDFVLWRSPGDSRTKDVETMNRIQTGPVIIGKAVTQHQTALPNQ